MVNQGLQSPLSSSSITVIIVHLNLLMLGYEQKDMFKFEQRVGHNVVKLTTEFIMVHTMVQELIE
jgi:hypothetical protein